MDIKQTKEYKEALRIVNKSKMNNNIKEDYCSFEIAKLLKEKGFDVPCNFYYYEKYYAEMLNKNRESLGLPERFEEGQVGKQLNSKHKGRLINRNKYDTTTSRPTYALAIKWIRENFGIHIHCHLQPRIKGLEISNNGTYQAFIAKTHHVSNFGKTTKNDIPDGIFRKPKNSSEEATEAAILYTLQNLIP